jgi:hypothetical protein
VPSTLQALYSSDSKAKHGGGGGGGGRARGEKEGAERKRGFLGFLFGGPSTPSPPLSDNGFSSLSLSLSLSRARALSVCTAVNKLGINETVDNMQGREMVLAR